MNGIQEDLEGTARVIRLDIQSDEGKAAARRFDVTSVPTTLLLDSSGDVVRRDEGRPAREEMVRQARAL